jgi:excisionase family DNA binding protein
MMELDRLLTADEAGRLLGLKVATIRRLTAAGELPVVRPTGRRAVRYRLSDLRDLTRMRSTPMRTSGNSR